LDQAKPPLGDVPLWLGVQGRSGSILAVRLKRTALDEILRRAVHSTFVPKVHESEAAWKEAVARSNVRLQFDPYHDPSGAPIQRRAIQLGLRGMVLAKYARKLPREIQDVSEFVREQSEDARSPLDRLITPKEVSIR
jgi:hypothetical protein